MNTESTALFSRYYVQNDQPQYPCIDKVTDGWESSLIVTNGASWDTDPASVQSHRTLTEAVDSTGYEFGDFVGYNP
jgi:hypothetical protein